NEVAFQKQWLTDRLHFLDTNFLNMPTLSSGTALVPSGTMFTVTPAAKVNSLLLYTLDGTDPRMAGGGVSPNVRTNVGALTLTITNNIRLFARSYNTTHFNMTNSGTEVGKPLINSFWSGPAAATYYTTVPSLRITELMYHPANPPVGDTNDADNFEYVELKNIGPTTLNLAGFSLSGGIDFTFPSFTLAAGEYCVVVKNATAFQSRYGVGPAVAGVFAGNLANDGDHVVLRGPLQEPIQDFVYSDSWYPLTDDHGFSLVVLDENGGGNLSTNTSWRRSHVDGGSPGIVNPAITPVVDIVLVNEALTHTDPPLLDTIELYNPGANAADISGWWLTDDFNNPKKFQIPGGTIVPPGGYVLFNEASFNVGSNAFALGSNGDDLHVFSGAGAFITGYHHGFNFGAAQNGRTFGRYVNSQTNEHFVAQAANTIGGTNSLPLVGPVVITEVMYHPPEISGETGLEDNSIDEFIELYNLSTNDVPLHHVLYPSNTWRLSSAVDFSFPPSVSIAPTSFVLVVSFDPAIDGPAFRAKYGVPANVPLYGPYVGKLDNSAESVRLSRPDAPNGPDIPFILVDRVDYRDVAPWAFAADGFGPSLHRLVRGDYGNDATNWTAARATPGLEIEGGGPPVILQQPMNVTLIEGMTTNISVAVSSATAVAYQWQQNSNSVPGATSATLVFSNIQPGQAGVYMVSVFNGGGFAFSTPVTVTVLKVPVISLQPQSQNVATNSTFNLSVVATGTGPLRYQWQFDGANIANATNATLTYSNAELFAHSGHYQVLVTDNVGPRLSQVATVIVLTRPIIIAQPVTQNVLQGQNAFFEVIAGPQHPLLPLAYRWILGGSPSTTNATGIFILTNVQPPNRSVRVAVTNLATGPGGLNSSTVNLIVLSDFDGDGMADIWEAQNGFNTNSSADASVDLDGDGMINRDEYVAGTNPSDPLSLLEVVTTATNLSVFQFVAQSNIAYAVHFRTNLATAPWGALTNIAAQSTGLRTIIVNSAIAPMPDQRYFRVVTPPPLP
ncbi:MAG TPA: lamin tail domain-containing protein, partial [Methylomirabilota bacterium]|nr:lamin tail domain-containing protein [Methylomirabilota bacterium]